MRRIVKALPRPPTVRLRDPKGNFPRLLDPGADPGADPGTDLGADLGTDPGTDLGADPGADLGADPGADSVAHGSRFTASPRRTLLAENHRAENHRAENHRAENHRAENHRAKDLGKPSLGVTINVLWYHTIRARTRITVRRAVIIAT